MPRWLKRTLIVCVVIFALLLSTMLIVPWQVKKQGIRWISENTSRSLTLEKVYFNPFTLTMEISGATLTEPDSNLPFVTFSRFLVSVSVRSIIDQALILDRLELDDPYANIAIIDEGQFNFSDFIPESQPEPEKSPDEGQEPFHFSLNNIIITNGSVDFSEQVSSNPSRHEVRQLSLSIPFLGNVPYLTDSYVKPELFMLLNGAELKVSGQLKPFHNSLETQLYVSFHNAQLPFYAERSPVALPVRVEDGSLDFEIDLSYLISADEEPQLMLGGEFALSDLNILEPDGSDLFKSPTFLISLSWANVLKQDVNVASIEIYEPQLSIDRDQAGQLNLARLLTSAETQAEAPAVAAETAESATPPAEAEEEQTAASNVQPFLLLLEKFSLTDGQIHLRDDSVAGGVVEEVKNIDIAITNLSTHPDQQADVAISFATDRDVSFNLTGQLGLNPAAAVVDVNLNKIPLEPYYPYLDTILTAPLTGQLSLWGKVHYTSDNNVLVEDGLLSLNNLVVPFGDQDQFTLATLQLRETTVNLQQQLLNLGRLNLTDGTLLVSRLSNGSFSPMQLLQPTPAAPQMEDPVAEPESASSAAPWQLSLASVDLVNFNVAFQDNSMAGRPTAKLKELNLHIENINYPEAQQSPYFLSFKPGSSGTISAEGSMLHTPLTLASQLQIADLALNDYNDFLPENLQLNLKNGRLFTSLAINLAQEENGLKGAFSGTTDLTDFDLRDRRNNGELLTWQGLNIKGIEGELSPFTLHVSDVALSNYKANIEISPEGQVNLTTVTAAPETAEPETAEPETAAPSEENAAKTPDEVADIRIDTVTMQGGTVSFTDRHLPNTFATTMYELGGRVSGLSSNAEMQADVDLRGNLENHSPLTVQGTINPLSKELFADLTISFKDIDLSPLTPYSGTYLGYAIDKGKLYLDLNYNIKHQHIDATNKVMIDQFTFGKSIKSDKATSLPVPLAIALLKNRNDEIHLDIPVSGDLDDPSFSLAGTIFTVLRNLLVKAATSPFSLLTAALGGGKDFSSVSFAPGTTTLGSEQVEKLSELAEVLYKRPGLTLEISAFADAENDPEAFRKAQLNQRLLAIKERELEISKVTAPEKEKLSISAEEYPQLITYAYKEADFPRPRTTLGTLKELPLEEMEKLLLSNILAGDEELAELAKQRAMVVRDTLQELKPELKPRLFLKQTDIFTKPDEGISSRVEFGISTK